MTTNKPRPCTLGKRHSWQYQQDVKITRVNGRSAQISLRGLYQCECGAKKYGGPSP
ncbi:hypothetical protein [Halopseudomonas bauzanensis]|uniref:hypothetical protein n=1 Tax=Halopseudomonas bauzanensis TaxID=653930 RepID=UPI00145D199F|nr:hypothetical protein [Halopseudomonas bauzanensis]